jgi:hypothetical protein
MRAEIEAQGWLVVDRGAEARLVRAHPLDVVDPDGATRYGWSGSVPEAAAVEPGAAEPGAAESVTVVLRALPEVEATDSLAARLTSGGTVPRHVLVVAGDGLPDPTMPGVETIRMRGAVSPGTMLAVALRRVAGGVLVVGERWPADATPADIDALAMRLGDPAVAVVGLVGQRSDDLRRFTPGGTADTPVEAVSWAGLAFRVAEGRERPPVDEGFTDPELFAAWWSLMLRDAVGQDGAEPRRAVGIRSVAPSSADVPPRDDRATRRDRYRLIDAFAGRDDLLVPDHQKV